MVVLAFLPGQSHATHLWTAVTLLILVCLATVAVRRPLFLLPRAPSLWWMAAIGCLILLWILALMIDAVSMPLTQNDALEYATVGRELFDKQSILAYPVLDSQVNRSGFYGPWTHPPLYVALIYLSYLAQGHAETPGLMRLIAPWFFLGATAVVFSLGSMVSLLVGALAALVFITTPLLFLGAGSALIDSLPVAGMALILAGAVGQKPFSRRRPILLGLLLGVALWTHSQAVLFVPLALVLVVAHDGIRTPWHLAKTGAIMLGVGTLISAGPYLRNLNIYGSPISDNPVVFALQQLDWPGYFRMSRGYESVAEKIQYGLFKGWAMAEAYSWAFWLATIGAVLFVRSVGFREILASWRMSRYEGPVPLLRAALAVVACYLLGVAASLAVGTDLMIRNERYLLVLMPQIALFAAIFLAACIAPASRGDGVGNRTRLAVAASAMFGILVLAVYAYQLRVVGGHKAATYAVELSQWQKSMHSKLKDWPATMAMDYLSETTPREALVLSMKPADMFYANRKMLSYLDPRLVPFYLETDVTRASKALAEMGVRYIHSPDYALPPVYNSKLESVMADPGLSRLVFSKGGHQIYELDSVAKVAEQAVNISPASFEWSSIRMVILGGRIGLLRFPQEQLLLGSNGISDASLGWPLLQRELSSLLVSGREPVFGAPTQNGTQVMPGAEYRLDLKMQGHAFAAVYLLQYARDGRVLAGPDGQILGAAPSLDWRSLTQQRIGEVALDDQGKSRTFSRRFITHADTAFVRVAIEHRGATHLCLEEAKILKIPELPKE